MILRPSGYRIEEPVGSLKADLWESEGKLIHARKGVALGSLIPGQDRMRRLGTPDWGSIIASGKIFKLPPEVPAIKVINGDLKLAADLVVIRPDGYQEVRPVEIWEGLEAVSGEGPKTLWSRLEE